MGNITGMFKPSPCLTAAMTNVSFSPFLIFPSVCPENVSRFFFLGLTFRKIQTSPLGASGKHTHVCRECLANLLDEMRQAILAWLGFSSHQSLGCTCSVSGKL